jgi:hypothetical protein
MHLNQAPPLPSATMKPTTSTVGTDNGLKNSYRHAAHEHFRRNPTSSECPSTQSTRTVTEVAIIIKTIEIYETPSRCTSSGRNLAPHNDYPGRYHIHRYLEHWEITNLRRTRCQAAARAPRRKGNLSSWPTSTEPYR